MKQYILTTFSRPVQGMEIDYNKWYDEIHISDLLKIPGILSARRFASLAESNSPETSYLAIYEIQTNDISELMQSLQDGSYHIRRSSAIDASSIRMQVYSVLEDGYTV